MRFTRRLRTYFITGLLILTPLGVTVYLTWQFFLIVDGMLNDAVIWLISKGFGTHWREVPLPGIGFLAILLLILFTGLIARNFIGRRLIHLGEKILVAIPLVNRIYKSVQQISQVFISEKREIFKKAVLFEYPRRGIYSVGFLTREAGGEIQERIPHKLVSVFLPTTPNPTSGYLLFIPEKEIIYLDMNIEDAIKLIISGGGVIPDSKIPQEVQNLGKVVHPEPTLENVKRKIDI